MRTNGRQSGHESDCSRENFLLFSTIGRRIIGNTILHCDGLESVWLFYYEVSTHTHTHTFTFTFTFHRCYSNEVELNVKLVNIIQHNTKFDCTIQSCYSPSAMYSLQYGYYTLLQIFVSKILRTYIMLSQLYLLLFVIFPSLKFELFFIVIT
jgi:hypothetical protein